MIGIVVLITLLFVVFAIVVPAVWLMNSEFNKNSEFSVIVKQLNELNKYPKQAPPGPPSQVPQGQPPRQAK
jgi:hypothetical protein